MKINSFSINIDKSKKLWFIVTSGILVALALITLTFVAVFKESEKSSFTKSELFEAKKFYAEYELNTYSNKNQNKYEIKEWYEKKDENYKFKIESKSNEGKVTFLGANNTINISSDGQISEMNLSDFALKEENILSISTFIDLYKKINNISLNNQKRSCCKFEEIVENKNICYRINVLNDKSKTCDICSPFVDSGMNISKFEAIFSEKGNEPKNYIIYDKQGKAMYDIKYNKFVINAEFDSKVFAK